MTAPTETHAPRLVMLPGLGADARQFEPQRDVLPPFEVVHWIPHAGNDTLQSYAHRMAERIDATPPLVLIGSSFGGMVAQEIASLLRAEAIILIASARQGDQIAPHLRYFGRFAGILPERTFEMGKGLTPLYASKFGRLDAEQRALLEAMVSDTIPSFVRWGIMAISNWEGADELSMPVHHIHGDEDELIPIQNVSPNETVQGAGHLVNVTHADQVNAFILDHLRAMNRLA